MSELNIKMRPKQKLVWINIILLSLMHIVSLYIFYIRGFYGIKQHWFRTVSAVATMLGITAGYHRLWCHKSYKANTALQIILMIFASSTFQKSCYSWVRDHRVHHVYTETDADPHNAKRGFFFSHIGWVFVTKHPDVKEKGKLIDMSDMKANPIVMFQHKYYYYIVLLFAFVIPTYIGYISGHSLSLAFMLSVHRVVTGLHSTWTVNSFAHLFGSRPYTKALGPTENLLVIALTGGEGFHNYHHTFPHDYKANFKRGDFKSAATVFIDLFEWLGMASGLKVAPEKTVKVWSEKHGNQSEFDDMNTFMTNVKFCFISVIVGTVML